MVCARFQFSVVRYHFLINFVGFVRDLRYLSPPVLLKIFFDETYVRMFIDAFFLLNFYLNLSSAFV